MRSRLIAPLALVLLVAAACAERGARDARAGGTVVIAAPADPDYLLPPLVSGIQGKQVTDQIFDKLAEIGDSLNTVGDRGFMPRLAERWEWSPDSLAITFHLDPRARWHDGVPVRASDVRFSYEFYVDPAVGSPIGPLLADIDSVTVRDSLTAVYWFKRRTPEQFFTATFNTAVLPEHLLKDVKRSEVKTAEVARHPVGTGRFRFASWVPQQKVELVADTANYRGRPSLDRLIWSVVPDYAAGVTRFFAGEADVWETMRPENIDELRRHPELKLEPYGSLIYGFLVFNLRDPKSRARPHPVLGDRAVRRALVMALDRRAMVRNVFDTLAYVAAGPFTRALWSADTTLRQLPYDTAAARRALDSLGWRDTNGDGIREKDGRPLEFSVAAPVSSKNRVRLAVLMQEQWKQVGAKVNIDQMEFTTFVARLGQHAFDAAVNGLQADPSPSSIRQSWSTAASRAKDGSNYASYENPAFDAVVDSAIAARDPARGKALYRRAYQMLLDDAPAVWLYELRNFAGVHRRIRVRGMRADAWWADIADWSIDPGQRIARDKIGLRPAAD